MTLTVDLYWSFRSPYSYLVTPRLVALARDYDVEILVRPVYPIALRIDGFFKQLDPLYIPYLINDTVRIAERLGLPFGWPNPDPVVMDIESGEVPKEQPYIHRLTRLGVAAAEAGRGLAFLDEVSRLIWSGTPRWDQGDHLAAAAARAGLDLAQLDMRIARDPEGYDRKIFANQDAQRAAGHWGVPLMVYAGEPFFGQDRFDDLKWRMERSGLARRAAASA